MKRSKTERGDRSRIRIVLFYIIITLTAFLGIGAFWYSNEQAIKQDESRVVELNATLRTYELEREAKKQEKVYITLPNAKPIVAPIENYEDPANLWTLVNKERPLPMTYVPSDLMMPDLSTRANATVDEKKVRSVINEPLVQMFGDAAKAGHELMIGSAYRSSSTQEQLFNSYVSSAGYEEANKYSAHAGHSEHQTGLAVDISTTTQQCYLSECFIDTADGQWLSENAHKYGFILRYPIGKEAITGYNFEPWHYRYVGIELATAIYESQLTLDQAWLYLLEALTKLRDNKVL